MIELKHFESIRKKNNQLRAEEERRKILSQFKQKNEDLNKWL